MPYIPKNYKMAIAAMSHLDDHQSGQGMAGEAAMCNMNVRKYTLYLYCGLLRSNLTPLLPSLFCSRAANPEDGPKANQEG